MSSSVYLNSTYTEEINGTQHPVTGEVLQIGVNAFNTFDDANNALESGDTLYVDNYEDDIHTGGKVINTVITNSSIPSLNTGMRGLGGEYDGDITVLIDHTTFGQGNNSYLVNRSDDWGNQNKVNGNIYITVQDSTIGKQGTTYGAQFFLFTGEEYVFEARDTAILNNLLAFGDSGPIGANQTVYLNLTNVTGTEDVYWCVIDGGQNHEGDIVISLTGSSVTASGLRLGVQGTWSYIPTCTSNITFNVKDSYFNGLLTAHSVDRNNNCNFSGNKVLNITGGSNYIREILHFTEVNLSAGATLTGSTMSLDNGIVNIDATGYDGPSKILLNISNGISGLREDGINVTGFDETKYTLVKGSNGVVLSDGSLGNLYYDKSFDSSVTGRIADGGDILTFSGDTDDPAVANAMNDFEGAKEKLATLSADKRLFAVLNPDLFGENNTLYTTLADADVTPFVNLVVTGGQFSGDDATIAVAAEGKTVAGDATIDLAGRMSNFNEIVFEGNIDDNDIFQFRGNKVYLQHLNCDYPSDVTINGQAWDDLDTPFEMDVTPDYSASEIIEKTGRNTIELTSNEGGLDLYFNDYDGSIGFYRVSFSVGVGDNDFISAIDGSKDSVGGVSRLIVSEDNEVGSIHDFDIVNVNANLTVGSLDVNDIRVKVNSTLTVTSTLSAGGTIHLVTDGVTGAGNLVLSVAGLSDLLAGGLALEFDESAGVVIHSAGSDDVWFMPYNYTGNVYVDASFTDAISGTFRNGDLLCFGVNAFASLQAAIEKQNNIQTLYVSGGSYVYPVVLDGFNMEIIGGSVDGITVKPETFLLVAEGATATGIAEKGGRVEVAEGATAQFVPSVMDDPVISSYTATAHSGTVLNRPVLEKGGGIEVFDGGVVNSAVHDTKNGVLTLHSGAVVNGTTVNTGNTLKIVSGAKANDTTVKSEAQIIVSSGAVVSNTTVDGIKREDSYSSVRGSMTVSGGTASQTMLLIGNMTVTDNGIANDVTVSAALWKEGNRWQHAERCTLTVLNGGVTNDVTVDWGEVFVSSGGEANRVIVNGYRTDGWPDAGHLTVLNHGVANDVEIQDNGQVYVSSGGVVNGTIITGHGDLRVSKGGVANDTTASSGTLIAFSGATVNGAMIQTGAGISCEQGATLVNVVLGEGIGWGIGDDVTVTGTTVNGNSWINVENGGVVNNTFVTGYERLNGWGWYDSYHGTIYVNNRAQANDTVLEHGNMWIYAGGTATNTILNAQGSMGFESGGTATNVIVNDQGSMGICSGATATGIIENGGWVQVDEGAIVTFQTNTIDGLTLGENHSATVHKGTTASNTTVTSGGRFAVFSGGIAEDTTVNTWDGLSMESGAAFINTLINENARMDVVTGATVTGATVNFNGRLEIASGAVATGIEEKGGWVEVQEGADAGFKADNSFSDLTLNANQSATAHTGTTAHNTTINGGYLAVFGGVADNTVVSSFVEKYDWWENVHRGTVTVGNGGTIQGTTIYDYSEVHVSSGARATDTTVTSSGTLNISSGGIADGIVVSRGGSLNIDRATDVTGVRLMNSGYLGMTVDSGTNIAGTFGGSAFKVEEGAVTGFEVNGMKSLTLVDGGTAESAVVSSDGVLRVSSGGAVTGATINENGQMEVSSLGTVTGGTVNNGGRLYITENGTAADLTVGNGGQMTIDRGATVTGLALENGARLELTVDDKTQVAGTSAGSAFEVKDGKLDHFSMNNGRLVITNSGIATDLTIEQSVELSVSGGTVNGLAAKDHWWWYGLNIDGGVLTGQITVDGGEIHFYNDGTILFNVSDLTPDMEDTTRINNYECIKDSPVLLATVSDVQMQGSYVLARNAASFSSYISVYAEDGTFLEEINLGDNQIEYAGKTFTLNLTDDVLTLDVETVGPVITIECDNTTPLQETTLTATSEPGVELLFSTDNKTWEAYTDEITVIKNATYYFKALDGEGNIGTNWIKIGNIDRIPPKAPVVTPSITTETFGKVLVSAEFSEDSVRKEYSLDNENWLPYTGGIMFAGNGTVYFRAVDDANNVSETVHYDVTNITKNELKKHLYVDVAFGTAGEGIAEGSTAANGAPLVWGENAFSNVDDAVNAMIPGQIIHVKGYMDRIGTGNRDVNLDINGGVIPVLINGATRGSNIYAGDISINIANATVGSGGDTVLADGVMGSIDGKEPWARPNTLYGNISVNVENSILGGNGRLNMLDYVALYGETYEFNVSNSTVNSNIEVIGDSRVFTGTFDINFTDVTFNYKKMWIFEGSGDDDMSYILGAKTNNAVGTINVNLKNVTMTGSDQGIGFYSNDWNWGTPHSSYSVTFSIDGVDIEGYLYGVSSVTGSDKVAVADLGNKTLKVVGGENYVRTITLFDSMEINASASITGSTIMFGKNWASRRTGGTLTIDATGYEGPTKVLIYMENGFGGLETVNPVIGLKDGYELVRNERVFVLSDGNVGNLYYNKNFTSLSTGRTMNNGDILIFGDDTENKSIANALTDFEGAKKKLATLSTDKKLFTSVDAGILVGDTLYGTMQDTAETPFVNLAIISSDLSDEKDWNIAVAAEGAKVTGDATIEIAGAISSAKIEFVGNIDGEGIFRFRDDKVYYDHWNAEYPSEISINGRPWVDLNTPFELGFTPTYPSEIDPDTIVLTGRDSISLTANEGGVDLHINDWDSSRDYYRAEFSVGGKGYLSSINGSKDSVDGVSTLVVSNAATVNNISDFDVINVKANLTVCSSLEADAITIAENAKLAYNGLEAIVVQGDLVNNGTFFISANGFVDGTQLEATVLTANSITGEGAFATDNDSYEIKLVGNEVHLVQKTHDVYVNTAWTESNGYWNGTWMWIIDDKYGTIGIDTFSSLEDANQAVSIMGAIYVLDSDVTFADPITHDVFGSGYSTVIRNAHITAGKTLTVSNGARVTAFDLEIAEGASVVFAGYDTTLDFDLSGKNPGSGSNLDLSQISGTPSYRLNISSSQEMGEYILATGAENFNSSVELNIDGNNYTSLSVAGSENYTRISDRLYSLSLGDGGELVFLCTTDASVPVLSSIQADLTEPTRQNVVVTAKFTDDYQLSSIYYKIGEYGSWEYYWGDYSNGASVTVSDNTTVFFQATDSFNNTSEIASYEVTNIDRTAPARPAVSADVTELTNGNVLVSATFSEETSIKEYSLDTQNWLPYTEPVLRTQNGAVYFRETDAAGNTSEIAGYDVTNIDKTAPAAPLAFADITAPTNGNVLVSAMFSEGDSTKEYSLDNENWQPYTEPVLLTENGFVYFRETDAAGNVSQTAAFEVGNINRVAPVISESSFSQGDGNYLFTANVTATDDLSNAESLKYYIRYADSAEFLPFAEVAAGLQFTLGPADAGRTLYYQAGVEDEAGNITWTDPKAFTVRDYTAPELNEVTAEFMNRMVFVTWDATDNVGVAGYTLTLNDKTYELRESFFMLDDVTAGDYTYQVTAFDEAGNATVSEQKTLTVEQRPDLYFRSVEIRTKKADGNVSTATTISVTDDAELLIKVGNMGDVASAQSSVSVLFGDGNDVRLDTTVASVMVGGEEYCVVPIKGRMSTGIQEIRVVLDERNSLPEYDDSNNERSLTLNVENKILGDLVIGSVHLDKTVCPASENAVLTFTVKNIGYDVIAASKAFIYDGENKIGEVDVASVKIGEETDALTYTIQAKDLTPGSHAIRIEANADNAASENNMKNNSAQVQLTVGFCDLRISRLFVSKDVVNTEEAVTVNFTVRNSGTDTATASVVGIYAGDTRLDTVEIGELSGGLSVSHQFVISAGALPAGMYNLRVVADDGNAVIESDKTNNSRSVNLQIIPKDERAPEFSEVSIQQGESDYTFNITASAEDDFTDEESLVYRIRYADTKEGLATADVLDGTVFSLTPEHAGKTMYYQVSATDLAGNTTWCLAKKFTVADHTAPEIGDVSVSVTNSTLTLSWEATDNVGVTSYKVYRVVDGGDDELVHESASNTMESVSTGNHTYRIEAYDAVGNVSQPRNVKVNFNDSVLPVIDSVAAEQSADGYGITFGVTASDNQTAAADLISRVQYAFAVEDVQNAPQSGLELTLAPEDAGKTLYYRVSAVDEAGNTAWSGIQSLVVADVTAPDTPVELAGIVDGSGVMLTWTASTDNVAVTGYQVRYGMTEALNGDGTAVADNQYTLASLKEGVYYWQAAAVDAAGNISGWSEVQSFRILPEDVFAPNGTADQAFDIGPLSDEQMWMGGAISSAGDADWFKFTLNAKGTANDYIQIDFDGNLGDLDLYLYSSNGTTQLLSSDAIGGDTERISLKDLQKGTYLLKVVGKDGAMNTFSLFTKKVAGYEMDEYDANSRNDSTEAATVFDLEKMPQATVSGLNLHETGDVDYYQFSLSNMGLDGDSVSISFENSVGDLDLFLFDSQGMKVAESCGTENVESISFSGLAAGTYYIQVSAANNAVNEYTLNWNFTSNKVEADWLEGEEPYVITESTDLFDLSISAVTDGVTQEDTFLLTLNQSGSATSKIRFSNYRSDWEGLKYVIRDANNTVVLSGTGSEISLDGLNAGNYSLTVDAPVTGSFSSYDISVSLPETAGTKWTYMVYMAADNNLDTYALYDLISMQQADLDSQIDIYVLVDRNQTTLVDLLALGNKYKWDSVWSDTRVGKITYSPGNVVTVDWESWGELDTSSIATLERFVDWTQNQSKAENYGLIMWDHGVENGSLCVDGTTDADWETSLSVSEVSALLEEKGNVPIVIFNNCLLGSENVATQMTGSTEVIVVSEAESYPQGMTFAYKNFFSTITADMSAQEMAKILVQNVKQKGDGSSPSTLSAVDVTDSRLATALEGLAAAVANAGNSTDKTVLINALAKARQDNCAYDGSTVYQSDLYDAVLQAMADRSYSKTSDEFKAALAVLKTTLEDVVILSKTMPANKGYGIATFNPILTVQKYLSRLYTNETVNTFIQLYLDSYYAENIQSWAGLLYDLATAYQKQLSPNASFKAASFSVSSIADLGDDGLVAFKSLGCFSGRGAVYDGIDLFNESYFGIAITSGTTSTGGFVVTNDIGTDVKVSVLSEDGTLVAGGTNGVSFADLPVGDYYILLQSDENCTITLSFEADWMTGVDHLDYAQSKVNEKNANGNGSIAKANTLAAGYYSGLLTYQGDSDLYQIGNVYTETYQVVVEGAAGMTVEEHDANNNVIQTAKYANGVYTMTVQSMNYLFVEGSADLARNQVDSYSVSISNVQAGTDNIPPAKPAASADVTALTNGDVLVSAEFSEDSVTKEYSLDGENWLAYTEPVKVTKNGTVFFRGTDAAGNVSEVTDFEVTNIDKEAPLKPTATADVTAVTNGDVFVSAEFSADSVVREYSLDGETWKAYTEAIQFMENGTVFFRSKDAAGNVSEVESYTVSNISRVAPDKPVATVDVTVPTNAAVHVSAVFNENSVSNEYSLNGTDWFTYTGSIEVSKNGTVYFRSTDAAGNTSEVTIFEVTNIDKEAPAAPVASADITTTTNGNVLVSAVFSEDSVVKEYSLDGENWQAYDEGGVIIIINGSVFFRSADAAGNVSKVTEYAVTNIDKEAPAAPVASADITTTTNGNVLVSAVFSEDSVVREYSLDSENWQAYTEAIPFAQNDTVFFRGTDAAGNVSEVTSFEVGNIDKEAPAAPVASADVTTTTKGNVLVSAVFSEDSVVREYSLDGENWLEYTAAILFAENGTVFFRGFDEARNISEVTSYEVANIVIPDNNPDDGANDYLWTKKDGWNDANIQVPNLVTGDGEINLDAAGTIDTDDGYHNLFGNDGTKKDTGDVAKIDVETAAKLTFTINSTEAGTFYVYEKAYDAKKKDYKQVTVGKVAVKARQTATLKDVCLTADGNYFVAMTAKNVKKAGTEGRYNVNVKVQTFFVDADNGDNDTEAKGQVISVGRGMTAIVLDRSEMTANTSFANFVGFDDNVDYAKLDLASSAYLSFSVTGEGDGKAKFTIWKRAKGTNGKLSKVTSVSLPAKKAYAATTKAQFLDTSKYEYYMSMECTDATKGKGLYYNVAVTDDTVFFDSVDNGFNNVLYNKKGKAFYGEDATHHFETTTVNGDGIHVKLDSDPVGDTDYENFVGYQDAADYAKITLSGDGRLSFDLKATGDATFVVYEKTKDKKGNDTLKAIQTTKLTLAKGKTTVEKTTDELVGLKEGEYYISMTAKNTKANDKGSVFYNVTVNATLSGNVSSALAMPETELASSDSLGISDALSFGQYDADALADASASSLTDPDDKSAWKNITTMA